MESDTPASPLKSSEQPLATNKHPTSVSVCRICPSRTEHLDTAEHCLLTRPQRKASSLSWRYSTWSSHCNMVDTYKWPISGRSPIEILPHEHDTYKFPSWLGGGGSLTDIRALPNGDPSTRAWHLQFSELAYMRGGEHWPISEINSETYKCQPYCTYILSHIDIFATSQTWGINTLSFTYVSCMFWWAKLHFGIYICIMYVHKGGKMQR